ncbi:MAG: protein-tyrosine phosphatase family protein [Deinococcales bacterium]
MFRSLDISGFGFGAKVFLTGLPGVKMPLTEFMVALKQQQVQHVLSLISLEELSQLSSEYAFYAERHLASTYQEGQVGSWQQHIYGIADYGVPQDMESYLKLIEGLKELLLRGENLLIHCHAGIGRTGMTAVALLLALGMDLEEALIRVREGGSSPETSKQQQFLQQFQTMISSTKPSNSLESS